MEQITKAKAVTLVETMASMVIFLIASVGFLSLQGDLARTSSQSQIVSQAVFVGQSTIDGLYQVDFEDLDSSEDPTYYDQGGNLVETQNESVFSVSWTVITPEDATMRNVTVTVSWALNQEFPEAIQFVFERSQ